MSISQSNKRDRVLSRLVRLFSVSVSHSRSIIGGFHEEMARGLAGERSSLRMIPSFVGRPTGREKGRFLALDLGGTNCRVLEVELDGRGGASIAAASRFVIPQDRMHGAGELLFDFLAGCVDSFIREHPRRDGGRERILAFTFSFPVEQHSIASGTLIGWTKAFTVSGVEGEDVAVLLYEAMKRKGLGSVRVTALTNDTVGTLVAGCYADRCCDMGVILGTGTNACYLERAARIGKFPGPFRSGEMIVNMEWGNFDRLKANRYDAMLDADSPNPGRQRLEKMVSGMYLGEIARLVIREMMERGMLFEGKHHPAFLASYAFTTEHLSTMAGGGDEAFADLGLADLPGESRAAILEIGRLVALRSARIAGAAITAVITWMDPGLEADHAVAIDGALFEKYPGYRDGIQDVLIELLGGRAERVALVPARDGSGIGAAVVGAVAASAGRRTV
ncbi:MAG: hypothetical protein HPY65_08355 [Syntrophaceae bacterium]|nr:hypothetical protein [Syntrophaceae bacterium]